MDKPDPWRCRFRMRVVKGRSGQCGGCWRYWSQCNDSSYVHQQPRHPQHQHGGAYTTGWLARFRTVGFRKIQVTTETNSKPQTTCAEAATPKFQRRCEQGKRQGSQQGLCRDHPLYIKYKVSADSRVPSRLFSFGTLAIVVSTRPRALALHLLRAFLRSGIPGQDTTAFAHCV